MQTASWKPANLLSDLLGPDLSSEGSGRRVAIGLLGRGIDSSRSPIMHEREGSRLGMRYSYRLIDFDRLGLDDRSLEAVVASAESLGFAGLNVTHPFKQGILPLLTELSPEAAAIGAVNTVVLGGKRRIGHNTDSWGFAEAFRERMQGCSLADVLLLGAGGAGAAVAHALLELGAERLALFDTSTARAANLARALNERFDGRVAALAEVESAFGRMAGIVNATPIGMAKYPGMPFPPEHLAPHHWVAEIVYFPVDTALLQCARARGCRTLDGVGMAVYQAVRAFELFTGVAPDRAAMAQHFEAAEKHV